MDVHFREPGFEYKETIATGSKASARGGFTTVAAMPNLNPVPATVAAFQQVQAKNSTDGVALLVPDSSWALPRPS